MAKIGMQTNVWSNEAHQGDLSGMLAALAAAGYDGFEIGAHRVDLDRPQAIRDLAAGHGLTITGIHTHGFFNDPGWVAGADEYVRAAATCAAAAGAPFLPMSGRPYAKSDDDLAQMAAALNRFGEAAQASGVRFCYHHHNWELADHWRELRALMAGTDPALVGLLVDIGWLARAGVPLADIGAAYGDRIVYYHVKDTFAGDRWAELGDGIVDLRGFAAAIGADYDGWLMVERDEPLDDAVASIRASRLFLRNEMGF